MPSSEPLFREIELWRRILSRDVAARCSLTAPALDLEMTRLIAGLVFLRLAETGGADPYCRLRALMGREESYSQLLQLLRGWNGRSGDAIFSGANRPGVDVSQRAFQSVLKRLYRLDGPHSMAELGSIYERFLGREALTDTRKVGGVYYTPPYIIEAILERTLEPAFQGRTPFDAAKITVLDPSCGCGAFLLGACDFLFQWHLDWYLAHYPENFAAQNEPRLYKDGNASWRLTPHERGRIVREHIHGVDIDAGAVEITRLSLTLKVLQGAANYEPLVPVPDLSANVRCGDALISPYYGSEMDSPFSFDWNREFCAIMESGGFDVVIGNPPYSNYSSRDSLRAKYERGGHAHELQSLQRAIEYCTENYADCSMGCKDLYKWFTARSLGLTRQGGQFGFIIPNTWLTQPKYADLKRKIFGAAGDLHIIDLGMGVFPVAVPTCIVIARKGVGEMRGFADLKPYKDKPAALKGCEFVPLPDDGRAGEHPLVKRYLKEWPETLKLKKWLTLREGQHIRRDHLVKGRRKKHIPVIDSKNMGRYAFRWGPRFCFRPAGNFRTTAGPRLVVRKTGDAIVAMLLPADESFVLQSLYQGVALHDSLAPEYMLGLLNSKFLTFVYQHSEFGQKGRILAQFRKGHLDKLPVPPFDLDKHDLLVELVKKRLNPGENGNIESQIDRVVYELYGLSEGEIALVEGSGNISDFDRR